MNYEYRCMNKYKQTFIKITLFSLVVLLGSLIQKPFLGKDSNKETLGMKNFAKEARADSPHSSPPPPGSK